MVNLKLKQTKLFSHLSPSCWWLQCPIYYFWKNRIVNVYDSATIYFFPCSVCKFLFSNYGETRNVHDLFPRVKIDTREHFSASGVVTVSHSNTPTSGKCHMKRISPLPCASSIPTSKARPSCYSKCFSKWVWKL